MNVATELYRELVAQQQERCDDYAIGYPNMEATFYAEIETRVTFKQVLILLKRHDR